MADRQFFRIVVLGDPKKKDGEAVAEDALKVFQREAKSAMREASDELLRAVHSQLRKSTTPPAAPGQPPAYRGEVPTLMGSFKRITARATRTSVSGGVQSSHPGAGRLEWGGTDSRGVHTFPHPYLSPAVEAAEPSVHNILSRVLEEA